MPPLFELECATSGGPVTVAYWTRDGGKRIDNNETFEATLAIKDYVNATYIHTLTVAENIPGTYTFFVQDPYVGRLIFDSTDVEGMFFLQSTGIHVLLL
jgi:hypothetical protein